MEQLLKTLEDGPQTVGGSYECQKNSLVNLLGAPEHVPHFFCSKNQLTTLEGGPKKVGGDFSCHTNELTSLMGCPESVGARFICSNNDIKNLEFCPQTVGGRFSCDQNPGLGDVQEIEEFKEIYAIHQEIVNIKKEKEQLGVAITPGIVNSENQNKSFKI